MEKSHALIKDITNFLFLGVAEADTSTGQLARKKSCGKISVQVGV